jgi:hypothetical protein
MKICRNVISALAVVAVLTFALAASRGLAQTILTNSYTNSFLTGGNTTDFYGSGSVASWIYWYGLGFNDTPMTNDPTMTASGDTNTYGSLYVSLGFGASGDQGVFFGTFNNSGAYNGSEVMPLNVVTQLAFDIHVQPGSPTNSSGDFGQITMALIDPGWSGSDFGYFSGITIPGSATNGWVHLVDANSASDIVKMMTAGLTQAAGVGFDYNSYGGYPTSPITFWIDNVAIVTAAAPPPPPPPPTVSISPTVQGLNLFTGNGAALNSRENLESINPNYSWVGASGPVSYSFTITNYPVGPDDAVQCQIFLCPNPGAESDLDWQEANVIFLDLESDVPNGGGALWNFRYKTNEPNGNTMIYGVGTLASIGTNTALGTWIVTFQNNTNVTMTIPGGASTNFNIPDSTGATTALFASGVDLYFGVQANNAGGASDHLVASDFSVTGLPAAFNDNFVSDAGTLNSNVWTINATYTNCVQLLGPGDPYWVQWTTPAIGFSLDSTAALAWPITNVLWSPVTTFAPIQNGSSYTQLISTNDLQSGNATFFSLVNRSFTQLLVLLAGETNAPNTATGKIGTPLPFSLSASGGLLSFVVVAVDARWFPVSGVTDTLSFSDNDGGIYTAPYALVNGAGQFTVFFSQQASNVAITATDATTPTITPNTSGSFTVGP